MFQSWERHAVKERGEFVAFNSSSPSIHRWRPFSFSVADTDFAVLASVAVVLLPSSRGTPLTCALEYHTYGYHSLTSSHVFSLEPH